MFIIFEGIIHLNTKWSIMSSRTAMTNLRGHLSQLFSFLCNWFFIISPKSKIPGPPATRANLEQLCLVCLSPTIQSFLRCKASSNSQFIPCVRTRTSTTSWWWVYYPTDIEIVRTSILQWDRTKIGLIVPYISNMSHMFLWSSCVGGFA